jgi:hypothetical protein
LLHAPPISPSSIWTSDTILGSKCKLWSPSLCSFL